MNQRYRERQVTDKFFLTDFIAHHFAGFSRTHKQMISAALDGGVIILSLWIAYSIGIGYPLTDLASTWHFFALMLLVTVLLFRTLGIYRWVIRSSNVLLMRQLAKGCLASALTIAAAYHADTTTTRHISLADCGLCVFAVEWYLRFTHAVATAFRFW